MKLQQTNRALIACFICLLLQACASQSPQAVFPDAVEQAYNTSGVVTVTPYTRTIFSTHNF